MEILRKEDQYRLWHGGVFGNKLRTWNSYGEVMGSGYQGTVTMRYRGSAGGGFVRYEVPLDQILPVQEEWRNAGAQEALITFNESAPDSQLVLQGEVMHDHRGYVFFHSDEKKKMRDALRQGRHVEGLQAKLLLEETMTPSSYADLEALFDIYSDSVVELSVYEFCLGNIPGRNMVVWEVRNY
ncbi:hypothetical protein HYT55_05395 [Candidatus Woesearchaeota archaeon]|nr:hypothetical protein [Candidatus Woesearchaeota archaeon]